MHIMIRQGAQERNLQNLIPLINDFNSTHISLVSDDRDVIDLEENGHMDHLVRTAISFGLPPVRAIQMASINTARYFGLKNIGAIAPGFRADFILLDDLESFSISEVFLNGKRIDLNYSDIDYGVINSSSQIGSKVNEMTSDVCINSDATYLPQPASSSSSSISILQNNTMHIKSLDDPNIFSIAAKPAAISSSLASIQVIGVIPGQIITQKRIIRPKVNEDYQPLADTYRDIAKLAVIERHHKTGNIGLGFIQGLGLKTGAIASSVAHDSHNLVVAGMNDIDMLTAAKHISLIGGGLAVVDNGQVIASLSLPIAGLMSDQNISSVISNLTAVNEACITLGDNIIKDPFMLLSFMSLPVVPSLKLTDKGLVDVDRFEFTNLWVD
jgi:adenine deaminase